MLTATIKIIYKFVGVNSENLSFKFDRFMRNTINSALSAGDRGTLSRERYRKRKIT